MGTTENNTAPSTLRELFRTFGLDLNIPQLVIAGDVEVAKLFDEIFTDEEGNSDTESNLTCKDCVHQDEDVAPAGSDVTCCLKRMVHVPLGCPACGDFMTIEEYMRKDCKNQRAAQKDALEELRAEFRERLDRKKAERKPTMFTCSTPDGGSGPWYDSIAGLSVDGKRRKEMMEKEYGVTISPDHWALFKDVSADFNKRMAPWLPMSADYTIHGFNIMPGPVTDTAVPEASRAARDHNEKPKLTCKDCANQDESRAPTGTEGITFCRVQGVNVPLSAPACGILFRHHKSEVVTECENTTPQTLQEKAKTVAETVSDLYYQIASLDSQKDALVAANKELLELSKNCPECEEYCKIADAVEEENAVLRDHNNRLVKDFLAAKSWKVGMEARLAHRGDTIRNLQAHIQGEAKEIDILKSSLRAAESALGAKEKELGQLRAYKDSASNAEKVREAIILYQSKLATRRP